MAEEQVSMSLSHQEDPWAGRDRRDDAEKFGAKLGVRLLCAPPPLHTHPFRTIAPILAPEPSVPVRKARCRSCVLVIWWHLKMWS